MFNKKKALTANFFLVSVQMHLSTEELIQEDKISVPLCKVFTALYNNKKNAEWNENALSRWRINTLCKMKCVLVACTKWYNYSCNETTDTAQNNVMSTSNACCK